MKVLHMISGGDKGGAKTAVFSLLLALDEQIDITVACFMEGVFFQEVQELAVRSVLFRQRFRFDLTVLPRLVRFIRAEKFDVIHAHGARANFICMMLRFWVKLPFVTTVHSDYLLDFTDKWYRRVVYTGLNTLALRKMDYFIGVSEAFGRMLVERGFAGERVFSIHNAVESERAADFCAKDEFLARYGIAAENKTLVGIIGRFDYVKGHDIFLRAAAEIARGRADVLFLLAGEGFEEGALRKLARTLGIGERVIFTGFVTDIFSFINAIDVNVCASRSESFPYMLHEGALLKKPAVSTDVGGISELITDGETGTLVSEGDYRALASAIVRYIDDPALAARHGEALHHHAVANFSKAKMQARAVHIYEAILTAERAANRRFDVMLSGYYGYANSGDDALLDAVINALRRERPDMNILVLSRAPAETMRTYGVFSINRLNFFAVRRHMKRTRLLVYGGGSHMQDITSTRSLVYYTFLIHLAKRRGMRVMLYGNGIGPIRTARNINKARRALEVCDYISLRDPESFAFVKKIGVRNENVAVSVDPVFSLDAPAGLALPADLPALPDGGYFVVSLRPWQYNDAAFVDTMVQAVNYTAATYQLTPVFIPMHLMDLGILREVARKTTDAHVLLPRVFGYGDIMAVMARAAFALCMRLHGLIYAVRVGVPVIGLVYDPKVANFMAYIGDDKVMNTSQSDAGALRGMVDDILRDETTARERIAAQRERLRALAAQDAVVAVGLL